MDYIEVVYNACYGGFSLSKKAIIRYYEIKGIPLWVDDTDGNGYNTTYWLCPPEERPKEIEWKTASHDECVAYNEAFSKVNVSAYDFEDRTDPILIQVIKELGDEASGDCADLQIYRVPKGSLWRIDEYDGNERVMTREDYEWNKA